MRPRSIFGALAPALLAAALGAGCASPPTPADYAEQLPRLDLATYFDGEGQRALPVHRPRRQGGAPLHGAHAVPLERRRRRARRAVHLQRRQDRAPGLAPETAARPGQRGPLHRGTGTASGQAAGNAFQWKYTLRLPVDGSVYEVQFDDWMYLMGDGVMLNKAVMSKFGIRLGEVTLAFSKPKQ